MQCISGWLLNTSGGIKHPMANGSETLTRKGGSNSIQMHYLWCPFAIMKWNLLIKIRCQDKPHAFAGHYWQVRHRWQLNGIVQLFQNLLYILVKVACRNNWHASAEQNKTLSSNGKIKSNMSLFKMCWHSKKHSSVLTQVEVRQNSTSWCNYCITGTALVPNVTKLRSFKINHPSIGVFYLLQYANISYYACEREMCSLFYPSVNIFIASLSA